MNVVLWVIAGFLGLGFMFAGAIKLLIPRERLAKAQSRRREFLHALVNLTYLALLALVAWKRFGPESFHSIRPRRR
jgi:hypothetical protein